MSSFREYRVLFGVALLNFSGGFSIFYGNFHAYIVSYYRLRLKSNRTDLPPAWILSTCLTTIPIGNLLADTMKLKFGLRVSVLIGCLMYISGFLISYLSVQNSVWATSLTFGVIGMFGLGVVEVLSYVFTSSWFPRNRGLAGSVGGASSAIGAIIYNSVITAYINPKNLRPDFIKDDIAYFTQHDILDRVPMTFIILGIVTFVTQILGCAITTIPDFTESEGKAILENGSGKCLEEVKSDFPSSSQTSLSNISEEAGNIYYNEEDERIEKYVLENNNVGSKQFSDILSEDDEIDKSPRRILKSITFYLLWFSLMALSLGMLIVGNYYKLFAELWIADDTFLTLVGSFSSISSSLVRIGMGFLSDKFRMKSVFLATLSTTSIFLAFWYFTAKLNRWMYFFSTNILAGLTGSVFVLYPIASMKFFGLTYFATNTGLVMLAMTIIEVVSGPFVTLIIDNLGWFGLFFSVSLLTGASFLATTLFMPRTQIL